MHELNTPEVVAEVTAAFERYDNGLAKNDVAVLDDSFRENPLTLRYGIGENLRSHAQIAAFRAARTPTQHAARRPGAGAGKYPHHHLRAGFRGGEHRICAGEQRQARPGGQAWVRMLAEG